MPSTSAAAQAVPTTIDDPQLASKLVDLFSSVLALADRVEPNYSDPETNNLPYRGALTLRQQVEAKLKQIGANVDRVPDPVRIELESLARIFQDMHTKCVTIPDLLAFIAGSDLRGPAGRGWQAVTAANPTNQNLFPWAPKSMSDDPLDLPEAIRAAQRQAAAAKEANESLDLENTRRQPVRGAWDGLYVSRPYPYGQDPAADEAWLVGWSQRLARLGETVSAAGFRANVETLSSNAPDEEVAIAVLKAALAGEPDSVLRLLRQCPMESGWHLPFNHDRLLAQMLDPRCGRCGNLLDQDHRCPSCLTREGKMFEIATAIECESKWGQPIPGKLAGSDAFKSLKHFACELFGHPEFDMKTLERLEGWMAAEHGKSSEDFLQARQLDVADLLREACRQKAQVHAAQNQSSSPAQNDSTDTATLEAEFETALKSVEEDVARDRADLDQFSESTRPTPEQMAKSEAWEKKKQAMDKILAKRHAARLVQFGWKIGQLIPADDPNFDKRHMVDQQAKMDEEAKNRVLGASNPSTDKQTEPEVSLAHEACTPLVTSDLMTTPELAKLADVETKTFLNQLSRSRNDASGASFNLAAAVPSSGQRPASFNYTAIRPWLLKTWPSKAFRFPESIDDARRILAAGA